jgi:hypothetical protein
MPGIFDGVTQCKIFYVLCCRGRSKKVIEVFIYFIAIPILSPASRCLHRLFYSVPSLRLKQFNEIELLPTNLDQMKREDGIIDLGSTHHQVGSGERQSKVPVGAGHFRQCFAP